MSDARRRPDSGDDRWSSQRRQVKVGIAESTVERGDCLLTTSGLGSCLAVALRDPTAEPPVAGLLHAMLPQAPAEAVTAEKFVDSGIAVLVEALIADGADRSALTAKLVGGSSMLGFDDGIGSRSVVVARRTLATHDVPVVAADVGGDHGRSVRFATADGRLTVRRATGSESVL